MLGFKVRDECVTIIPTSTKIILPRNVSVFSVSGLLPVCFIRNEKFGFKNLPRVV